MSELHENQENSYLPYDFLVYFILISLFKYIQIQIKYEVLNLNIY